MYVYGGGGGGGGCGGGEFIFYRVLGLLIKKINAYDYQHECSNY